MDDLATQDFVYPDFLIQEISPLKSRINKFLQKSISRLTLNKDNPPAYELKNLNFWSDPFTRLEFLSESQFENFFFNFGDSSTFWQ